MLVLWLATGLLGASQEKSLSGRASRRRRSLDRDDPAEAVGTPELKRAEAPQKSEDAKPASSRASKSGGYTIGDVVGVEVAERLYALSNVGKALAEKAEAERTELADAIERAALEQEIALLEAVIAEDMRIEQEEQEAAEAFMAYLMAA